MGPEQAVAAADDAEHELPVASPWVPRVLVGFGSVALLLMAASWWNPWRFLLLDDHDLQFTAAGYFGLCALDVALWLRMRPGWVRRLALFQLTIAVGVLGLLLLVGAPFVLGDNERVDRIGSVHDGSVHTVYSSFFMSGCYQFEVRDESGWLTRHREVGLCLDDEKEQPTASTNGNRLTVSVGDQTCEYVVDAPGLRVEPVDPACDVLRSPPGR